MISGWKQERHGRMKKNLCQSMRYISAHGSAVRDERMKEMCIRDRCMIVLFYDFIKRMLFKIIGFNIAEQMVWQNSACKAEWSPIRKVKSCHMKYRISLLKMQQTCFFAGTYCLLDYYTGAVSYTHL